MNAVKLGESIWVAFGGAWLAAPPLGMALTLLSTGKSVFFDAEANSALLLILVISYVITLLGLMLVGLPLTILLEKIGGSVAVGSVIGLSALYSLAMSASTRDEIGRQAFLTLGLTAGIFILVYLVRGKATMASGEQPDDA